MVDFKLKRKSETERLKSVIGQLIQVQFACHSLECITETDQEELNYIVERFLIRLDEVRAQEGRPE